MDFINKAIVQFVKLLPKNVVFIFAKQYISGVKLQSAIEVVKKLNAKGIRATMDVLGESVYTKEEALAAKDECLRVLEGIEKNKLDANLSIKPTQLGMLIDDDFNYQVIKEIIQKAKELNNFVRIDMEDSSVTQKTIDLYLRMKKEFGNVGIVLQAYMRRTLDDVKFLNKEGAHYRLCKGIYIEPEEIAFKKRDEIRKNYLDALRLMFENGNFVGIATHDKYLIDEAKKMIKEFNVPQDKYEFQMLYGVTERMRDQINAEGYKIRVYVPFGEQWYPYSIRRLQENPAMAGYITKSLFTRR
ncbi:MAG: proline dehydrogenase [Chlorobi bacterium]|nr:proline dehydrogenase [Chlorobiota bacterium]